LRQAVDAQPAIETAAFEGNHVIRERCELDLARYDIRFEAKRAARRVLEPEIDAAKLPVVTEFYASAVPSFVSCSFRSGLRKFTAAKRWKRLPVRVNFPCPTVSRPRR
jgi:hypothetical protein